MEAGGLIKSKPQRRYRNQPTKQQLAKNRQQKQQQWAAKKAALSVILRMAERKYYDQTAATGNINQTGVMIMLHPTAQGDSAIHHDGDSYFLHNMLGRFSFARNGADASIRIIIFQWFQSTATPTTANILQNVGAATSYLEPLNVTQKQVFRVIKARTFVLDTYHTRYIYNFFIHKFPRRKVRVAAAGNSGSNNVYMLLISDVAADYPTCNYNVRTKFLDN